MPVTPDRLAVMAGTRAARETAKEKLSSFGGTASEEGSNCDGSSRPPLSAMVVLLFVINRNKDIVSPGGSNVREPTAQTDASGNDVESCETWHRPISHTPHCI